MISNRPEFNPMILSNNLAINKQKKANLFDKLKSCFNIKPKLNMEQTTQITNIDASIQKLKVYSLNLSKLDKTAISPEDVSKLIKGTTKNIRNLDQFIKCLDQSKLFFNMKLLNKGQSIQDLNNLKSDLNNHLQELKKASEENKINAEIDDIKANSKANPPSNTTDQMKVISDILKLEHEKNMLTNNNSLQRALPAAEGIIARIKTLPANVSSLTKTKEIFDASNEIEKIIDNLHVININSKDDFVYEETSNLLSFYIDQYNYLENQLKPVREDVDKFNSLCDLVENDHSLHQNVISNIKVVYDSLKLVYSPDQLKPLTQKYNKAEAAVIQQSEQYFKRVENPITLLEKITENSDPSIILKAAEGIKERRLGELIDMLKETSTEKQLRDFISSGTLGTIGERLKNTSLKNKDEMLEAIKTVVRVKIDQSIPKKLDSSNIKVAANILISLGKEIENDKDTIWHFNIDLFKN